jgi:tRNA-Thr(GGU) m(6)t(6)A37 methyltransferase TsaA
MFAVVVDAIAFTPIGIVRTPFVDRASAPRQAVAARDAVGTIELFPGRDFERALTDLEGWGYIWVLFVFHLNEGWRPKILPPRSEKKRGVFATRAPYRPNPIGMSAVELVSVSGLTLHVRGVDMIDQSPVLDIKPYVPYADAFPHAKTGWLAPPVDPDPGFTMAWEPAALERIAWLRDAHGVDLEGPIARVLSLGPQPHPYRRIRKEGEGFRLSLKEWRVRFRVAARTVTVESIATGYRPSQLAGEEVELTVHREFVGRFGR